MDKFSNNKYKSERFCEHDDIRVAKFWTRLTRYVGAISRSQGLRNIYSVYIQCVRSTSTEFVENVFSDARLCIAILFQCKQSGKKKQHNYNQMDIIKTLSRHTLTKSQHFDTISNVSSLIINW